MSALFHKTIFDRMPNAAMVLNTDLVYVDVNDAYCDSVQRQKSDLIGNYVFDVFPDTPERIAPVMEAFQQTLAGEPVRLDAQPYKLVLANGDIEDRIWQITQFPIRCDEGNVEYLVQRCEDVTEREELRQQRDLVTAELNHRVRNTLAVVQSIAEHTGLVSNDIESFLQSFSGRLSSMSRNFAALTDSHWSGLDFEGILRAELAPYAGPALDRVTLTGAPTKLIVRASKTTSMLVHELVTNASKYGFLTAETGCLKVRWWLEEDQFHVVWQETGLRDVRAPDTTGFGFQLFDMFPNIEVDRAFRPDGLTISIRVPVSLSVKTGELAFDES